VPVRALYGLVQSRSGFALGSGIPEEGQAAILGERLMRLEEPYLATNPVPGLDRDQRASWLAGQGLVLEPGLHHSSAT